MASIVAQMETLKARTPDETWTRGYVEPYSLTTTGGAVNVGGTSVYCSSALPGGVSFTGDSLFANRS